MKDKIKELVLEGKSDEEIKKILNEIKIQALLPSSVRKVLRDMHYSRKAESWKEVEDIADADIEVQIGEYIGQPQGIPIYEAAELLEDPDKAGSNFAIPVGDQFIAINKDEVYYLINTEGYDYARYMVKLPGITGPMDTPEEVATEAKIKARLKPGDKVVLNENAIKHYKDSAEGGFVSKHIYMRVKRLVEEGTEGILDSTVSNASAWFIKFKGLNTTLKFTRQEFEPTGESGDKPKNKYEIIHKPIEESK